jgi:hypothetical protein
VTPDQRLRELAIRHAAFGWLDRQRATGKETFTQRDTSNLQLAGETLRLMPTQQGVWKPAQLDAALSFRTTYAPKDPHGRTTTPSESMDYTGTRCAAPIQTITKTAPCERQRISGCVNLLARLARRWVLAAIPSSFWSPRNDQSFSLSSTSTPFPKPTSHGPLPSWNWTTPIDGRWH